MKYEPGIRVMAILKSDDTHVYSLGEGVYKGKLPSPLGVDNPCIELDNSKIVWGFECWWGPVDQTIASWIKGREVVTVDIDEARAAARD